MENLTGLLVLGSVISGIKLLWALAVPVIMYLICKKIWSFAPKWIPYSLIFVAFVNFHNVAPVILSRMLSVTHYSYVILFSNILNATGSFVFLVAVYGIASELKPDASSKA
jgi:hypothetical protein